MSFDPHKNRPRTGKVNRFWGGVNLLGSAVQQCPPRFIHLVASRAVADRRTCEHSAANALFLAIIRWHAATIFRKTLMRCSISCILTIGIHPFILPDVK